MVGNVGNLFVFVFEDHLALHVHANGKGNCIVNQRVVLRSNDQNQLQQCQHHKHHQRHQRVACEEEHQNATNGNHCFHGVLAQNCPCKQKRRFDFDTVAVHDANGKNLFANCLAVAKHKGNDKLEHKNGNKKTQRQHQNGVAENSVHNSEPFVAEHCLVGIVEIFFLFGGKVFVHLQSGVEIYPVLSLVFCG